MYVVLAFVEQQQPTLARLHLGLYIKGDHLRLCPVRCRYGFLFQIIDLGTQHQGGRIRSDAPAGAHADRYDPGRQVVRYLDLEITRGGHCWRITRVKRHLAVAKHHREAIGHQVSAFQRDAIPCFDELRQDLLDVGDAARKRVPAAIARSALQNG